MLNLHTEKEMMTNIGFFSFKLRNLYLSDPDLFFNVVEYLPQMIHLNSNHGDNLEYKYRNNSPILQSKEMDLLFEKGGAFLPKITCPKLYHRAKNISYQFQKNANKDSYCSYFQGVLQNNQMVYIHTNKLMLKDDLFFNITNLISNIDGVSKVFNSVFEFVLKDQVSWERFNTLTEQEKIIIRLLANGSSNVTIGEQLCISPQTVKTHRRNIYQKLDVHKVSDLVKIAIALDLFK